MKTTFTPTCPVENGLMKYPTYRRFYDTTCTYNLFNDAIVLFIDSETMFIVHVSESSSVYVKNTVIKKGNRLFIPATDSLFHNVHGKLELDF